MKPTNNQIKTIAIIVGVILIVIILIINYVLSQTQKPVTTITVPITPEVSVSPTPTGINYFQQTAKATLTINWDDIKPEFKKSVYPTYDTTSILTDDNVDSIAIILGFTDQNKKVLEGNDMIWTKDQEILLYISANHTLDYQNQTKFTVSTKFNETNIINKAKQLVSTIYPQLPLTLSTIRYFKDDAYQPIVSGIENSKLVEINFDQTLETDLLIPTNLSAEHFFTVFMTPDLNITSFRNSPGYQSLKATDTVLIPDYNKLITTPTDNFRILTLFPVDKQSIIDDAKKLNLTVTKIQAAYTIIGSTARPLYYVSGTLLADGIKIGDNVVYVTPMINSVP